jgi:plasmid stability protein
MQTNRYCERPMANLTIRKLDPNVKERLRVRAARHGHSMEEEARRILGESLTTRNEPTNAFDRLRRHFADIGGVELELPPRLHTREPPTFE